jgi:hypothetical protein
MKKMIIISQLCLSLCSCGEKIFTGDVKCSECYTTKPDSADLVVDLTINNEFDTVPLVIYMGDAENNQIEYIDTAYASPYFLYVALNKKYSVKAKYRKEGSTLFAIDGTKIKALLVTDACDQDCYVIKNEKVNVEIRSKFNNF